MARRDGKRRLVVDGRTFFYTVTAGDEEGIVARAWVEGAPGRLYAGFSHGNLVTPFLVAGAIRGALAGGWDPAAAGVYRAPFVEEVARDRPVAAVATIADDERAILARIAAAPDDDRERLLYADWLLERGDLAGERIALSCLSATRALTPDEAVRLEALEAERDETWLGPVAAVTRAREWHRGLLDACHLTRETTGVVGAAVGHRAWASVRTIVARGGYLAPADVALLVGDRALVGLRSLELDRPALVAVAARWAAVGGTPIEELRVIGRDGPLGETLGVIEHAGRLRRLVLLIVEGGGVKSIAAILTRDAIARLEQFTVEDVPERLPRWLEALDAAPRAPRTFAFGFAYPGSATLRFERDERGAWSRLAIGWEGELRAWPAETLARALELLDRARFTSVTVDGVLAAGDNPARDALARFRP